MIRIPPKTRIVFAAFGLLLALSFVTTTEAETKKERLDSLIRTYEAKGASFSVFAENKDGHALYEYNKNKPLAIASLAKVLVTGAALKKLERNHKFSTQLFIKGNISAGTLEGALVIKGTGDVSLSTRYYDEPLVEFRRWAATLKALGINRIEGDLIVDGTYFDNEFIPPDFPRSQELRAYCAPVSPLSFNENTVWVVVSGTKVGERAAVSLSPIPDVYKIENRVITVEKKSEHLIDIKAAPGGELIVEGKCHQKTTEQKFAVSVREPLKYFGQVVLKTLTETGIKIKGDVKVAEKPLSLDSLLVAEHSISLIPFVATMNKESVNLYAEVLLKVLGKTASNEGSRKNGLAVLKEYLSSLGVDEKEHSLTCGSGLAYNTVATSKALVETLRDIEKSLPLKMLFATAGVDGTLEKRFTDSPLKGKVWAKTGHLRISNSIAGVAQSEDGGKIYFAIIINGAERFSATT
ncbi:MAG: D-alanyl-D-alanine carboxypeptidase/D-alanyl-D-alanine-endopeptidase, partial [Planctomycetota bacterium]|nr:D-alanyl-D-alanine carboxypeptidase/D-alanyl-D-alanine-endopeptidase [Planctomycetota bacterium]